MIMQAVIIAGGKGTRLAKYTGEVPKSMIPIAGKPVLEHQIESLKENGIRDIVITVGHLKNKIIDYFGDGSGWGVNISYIEEDKALGTAGAFYYLKNKIRNDFFVVFGDVIFDINISRLYKFYQEHKCDICLVAHPNSHPYDSNLIDCDENYMVREIVRKDEKRKGFYANLVNAGAYIMTSAVLDIIKAPVKMDLENDVVSKFVTRGRVCAYRTTEYLKDMGTLDRFGEVERHIISGTVSRRNLSKPQKCVFLDRDGTINKYNGLISNVEQLELEEKAAEAIKLLNDSGYLCIVVTNQPVIARNLCTFEELKLIHNKMETLLGNEGAYVDDIFICPHHPDAGYPEERKEYKIKCSCRKPSIGLIQYACNKYCIDTSQSYMVGDTTVDIQTGKNAEIKTILLKTGIGGRDYKYHIEADVLCNDLLEAVLYIINNE